MRSSSADVFHESGKFADIIAVNGNPLDDIALMQKVDFVMKGGAVVRQAGHAVGE